MKPEHLFKLALETNNKVRSGMLAGEALHVATFDLVAHMAVFMTEQAQKNLVTHVTDNAALDLLRRALPYIKGECYPAPHDGEVGKKLLDDIIKLIGE